MEEFNRIIFVCESGTARSPMAAGILNEFSLKRSIDVESRGLVVLFPEPMNQKAEAVLISNGVSMMDFMSIQLTEEDFMQPWLTRSTAATSSSQTPSDTSPTLYRLQRSIPTFSSATLPA